MAPARPYVLARSCCPTILRDIGQQVFGHGAWPSQGHAKVLRHLRGKTFMPAAQPVHRLRVHRRLRRSASRCTERAKPT